ncbi:hypothetical protein BP00DRAFT_120252 [Aspergillus indologenus CBS 114.80]|uniref:Uncharacterized protein n=1 Tax=Aspergillus indologenus CBS 114.80 TaxID=1450541 RepID=A0A2V5HKZ6_9EURO|nr:hypothetical protein BP00DRAFT_120252 [Aspergillus indologenus CBS 114.80]
MRKKAPTSMHMALRPWPSFLYTTSSLAWVFKTSDGYSRSSILKNWLLPRQGTGTPSSYVNDCYLSGSPQYYMLIQNQIAENDVHIKYIKRYDFIS